MFTRDLIERVVVTAIEAALAVWIADGAFDLSVSTAQGAGVAALTAAAALLKGILAKRIGDPDSASLASFVPPPDSEGPSPLPPL